MDPAPTDIDPDLALGEFPGAHAPDRDFSIVVGQVEIAIHEWGDIDAPPLFMAHGGFDFARTYDVFAPLLAAAGWRVVGWDQRGHGDSGQTELYSFEGDLRDAAAVMESVTSQPAPVLGHSKGGSMMIQLADSQPFRFSHLVNLDGIPFKRGTPDIPDHERTRMMTSEVESWLDSRRRVALAQRKPGTVDELARRRGTMNPRLPVEWLRHLVTVGGRHDADGWRWKIDPAMRMGGFGPWRPEWTVQRLAGLAVPFLGILGSEPEPMGFGTRPKDIAAYMPSGGRCELIEGAGHFVHIEQPDAIAAMVLDFIGPTGARR